MDRTAYDRYFALEESHFWRVARRRLVLELLERHRPGPAPLRILDVGGACSLIPREMQRFGAVTVIEPDAATVEFSRRELALDVRRGSLPDQLPVEGPFDVVTLLDVLEHVDDDAGALRAIRALLRPGGLLLLTVPAVPLLWSAHNVSVHHKRRYLRDGLLPLLVATGFRVDRLSYHTCLLFPLLAIQRIAGRLEGIDPKAEYDVKVPPGPINRAFGGVMELERKLFRRMDLPIGSSLVAVCTPAAHG